MTLPCGHAESALPPKGKPYGTGECRPCWLYVNDANYRAMWGDAGQLTKGGMGGPGAELTRLLASLGMSACLTCQMRAQQMDEWGVDGCKANRHVIVGWLREKQDEASTWVKIKAAGLAVSHGLLINLHDPLGWLVDEAIRRARSVEKRAMLGYFDRVVVINLRRRPDRMTTLAAALTKYDWPFRYPERFDAIDGAVVPVPVGWVMGGGCWGCLASHRAVLQAAIMDDVQSLLVLEDDVCMRPTIVQEVSKFLTIVPDDWDQLMLGGQHIVPPRPVKQGVARCSNCQRTHAYAIRGRMLRDLYAVWCSPTSTTHCDHIMGPMQAKYNVYAPDPFLFGQSRSQSDISGSNNPTKFWVPPTGKEPLLLLSCSAEAIRELRERGVHTGYQRHPDTDIDVGLQAAMSPYNAAKLRKWIIDLQWECASEENFVLGAWHPDLTLTQLRQCYAGPVIEVNSLAQLEAIRG